MDDQQKNLTDRITINLSKKTAKALNEIANSERITKTEVVNRSINAYAYLTSMQESGWSVILRNSAGIEEGVRFL